MEDVSQWFTCAFGPRTPQVWAAGVHLHTHCFLWLVCSWPSMSTGFTSSDSTKCRSKADQKQHFWSRVGNPCLRSADCMHCLLPSYTRDLSIHGFGYPLGPCSWCPTDPKNSWTSGGVRSSMQTIDCMGVDPPTPTVQGSTVHECIHGDFQPFPSHGTHKLITKILWHTKKVFFCQSENKIGIILIHSHQMAVVL